MINIKKLLPILTFCLLSLTCEQGWLEDIVDPTDPIVEGCNISTACNYNPDVNKFDDSCEYASCVDCLGYPHGVAVIDSCGTCDASTLNDCTQDCSGTWGGTATTDNCGNCSTSSIACELDCMGVFGGSAIVDACDVCGGSATSTNDCSACDSGLTLGCDGVCSATPAVNDVCDICGGDGFHMPSDEEFMELEMELGMSEEEANSIGYRGTDEGSQLAGNSDLWNDGILENNSEFGTSGFNALPAGYRSYTTGTHGNMGTSGYFWSSSEEDSNDAWHRELNYDNSVVARIGLNKQYGFSIRCLAD